MGASKALNRMWRTAFQCLALLTLGACASTTTVGITPSPQAPVCASTAPARVLWTTQWRADQKDVPAREAAAAQGVSAFFQSSNCFAAPSVLRVPPEGLAAALAVRSAGTEKVVVITVRELGPTLLLGAPAALVDGATEVKLEVTEYVTARPTPRAFSVHWRSGGPGVVKGVASLPQDMRAALAAALQPATR
jgi:hypothetical protein